MPGPLSKSALIEAIAKLQNDSLSKRQCHGFGGELLW